MKSLTQRLVSFSQHSSVSIDIAEVKSRLDGETVTSSHLFTWILSVSIGAGVLELKACSLLVCAESQGWNALPSRRVYLLGVKAVQAIVLEMVLNLLKIQFRDEAVLFVRRSIDRDV